MVERDDIVEYAQDSLHSEEKGVEIRKEIVKVTILLSVITAVEILAGVFFGKHAVSDSTWVFIKYSYIVLTLVKAAYIVLKFMHLGDERKSLRWTILIPYIFFMIYLIFIVITEAVAVDLHNYNP